MPAPLPLRNLHLRRRLLHAQLPMAIQHRAGAESKQHTAARHRDTEADEVGHFGDEETGKGKDAEETEAHDGGDAAADGVGGALLHDGVGEAEQGGGAEGEQAHGQDRLPEMLREGQAHHARADGGGAPAHVEHAALGADGQQQDGADEGADAGGGHEHAVGLRIHVEHVPRVERHGDHEERRDAGGDGDEEREHGERRLVAPHVVEALLHAGLAHGLFFVSAARARMQSEQRGDEGEEAGGVRIERGGGAEPADEPSTDGGSGETGGVEDGAIHRDGGLDLAGVHEFRRERGGGGHFKRGADAEQDAGDEHMPDGDGAARHEVTHGEREHDLHDLGDDEDEALVVAVGHDAAVHGQEQHGNAGAEVDQAERQRAGGETSDDPALGHLLHPRAEHGDGLARHVAAEGAASEDVPGVGVGGGGGGRHGEGETGRGGEAEKLEVRGQRAEGRGQTEKRGDGEMREDGSLAYLAWDSKEMGRADDVRWWMDFGRDRSA